ncbi:hypothetical protein NADFUDRAFT_81129 [Nadsonia fulvescens var. elongata DSM 6958]|uniref:Nudix hydrolase domain-containing protein n=1 Tax=Nadsonia fulvescens var. elongata DSM 6958 TaxID=857566 RepID=A0A1E3PRJ7_9ASCO|nr:hypothetical protein NADFUDRAFT_81129 [Nadsonia fulvescens var. elongata DSM 6958]
MSLSNLDLVNLCDSVPYPGTEAHQAIEDNCYRFYSHDGVQLGLMIPVVVKALGEYNQYFNIDETKRTISLDTSLDTEAARSAAIAQVSMDWKLKKLFHNLEGWRNELYAVYNPTRTIYFLIERAVSVLFGVNTYGVHITGYVPPNPAKGTALKLWIPRRSYTKPTFPGMLDNCVAGGLGYPHGLFQTAIKECEEEAGLKEEYVKTHLKPAGVISYIYRKLAVFDSEDGILQPEVEYVYDLVIEEGIIPEPCDGEVDQFFLMELEEVLNELAKGSFKPNSAIVTIDFLIRHGLITPETETNYMEICSRIHRRLPNPSF